MRINKIKVLICNFFQYILKTPVLRVLSFKIIVGIVIDSILFLFFLKLTDNVLDKKRFIFDNSISLFFYHQRNPFLTLIMQFFSFIGKYGILLQSILIPTFFYWKKRKHEAILFSIIVGMGAALNIFLKFIAQRPRPTLDALAVEHSFSFPSGHSMNSFIFFIAVVYFYYHFKHKKIYGSLAFIVAIVIILCIGISRVYLGVHYPSDVIGGYLAGLVWLFSILLIEKIIIFCQIFRTRKIGTH